MDDANTLGKRLYALRWRIRRDRRKLADLKRLVAMREATLSTAMEEQGDLSMRLLLLDPERLASIPPFHEQD